MPTGVRAWSTSRPSRAELLLLLTSADDPYGSADAATAFEAVARPGTFRVVVTAGAAHGVDLLSGRTAAAVLAAVDAFLGHVSWS